VEKICSRKKRGNRSAFIADFIKSQGNVPIEVIDVHKVELEEVLMKGTKPEQNEPEV